jgi:hypothetical protein
LKTLLDGGRYPASFGVRVRHSLQYRALRQNRKCDMIPHCNSGGVAPDGQL